MRKLCLLGLALPGAGLLYLDGPPLGHTGGFGEPTCHACHFDRPLNSPEAWVGVKGAESFSPDSLYDLTVAVSRSELGAGGFLMSSRFPDGSQAGSFASLDDRTAVELDAQNIQFAMHALGGTEPAQPDSIFWNIRWTAPSETDTVVFHIAANAANGDDSELGDLIVTTSHKGTPSWP